jgi:hypothetical protein
MAEEHSVDDPAATKNQSSVNRRRFVKALAVTGTTSVFGFGTAAGKTLSKEEKEEFTRHEKRIQKQYSSVPAIQDAMDNLGSDYLQRFDAENFFDNSVRDVIASMEITTWEQMVENDEGMTISLNPNQVTQPTPSADITFRNQVGDDVFEVHILPGEDRSFAVKNPTSKEEEGYMTPLVKTQGGLAPKSDNCYCEYQCHSAKLYCDGSAWFDHPEYCVTYCETDCYYSKIGCCTVKLDCNTDLCKCE